MECLEYSNQSEDSIQQGAGVGHQHLLMSHVEGCGEEFRS